MTDTLMGCPACPQAAGDSEKVVNHCLWSLTFYHLKGEAVFFCAARLKILVWGRAVCPTSTRASYVHIVDKKNKTKQKVLFLCFDTNKQKKNAERKNFHHLSPNFWKSLYVARMYTVVRSAWSVKTRPDSVPPLCSYDYGPVLRQR